MVGKMKNEWVMVAVAALAAFFAYTQYRRVSGAASVGNGLLGGSLAGLDGVMASVAGAIGGASWRAPAKYREMIQAAEVRNGIPAGLLERLLYQECRWRDDIITGRVRSSVGAVGIAQFMPATAKELGIDPLNPAQAIAAAGVYLARLYRSTGTWTKALAAYNWGIGNVQRKGLTNAPSETRTYYASILRDVNASAGTSLA
jgi:soluble lytic murein transglycosylase-like protein